MGICRLCGVDKSADGSITLTNQVKMGVTFKELVEYYCRIDIDSDLSLPQMVCLCCKTSILKFTEFSYKAGQVQDTFVRVKIEDTEDFPSRAEPSPMKMEVDDNDAMTSEVKRTNDTEDNLLVEVPEEEALGRGKRARTKSIYVREAKNTALARDNLSRNLEEVEKLFVKPLPTKTEPCEQIEIPEELLLEGSEVPIEWLQAFDNFRTWKELSWICNCKCKEEIEGFGTLKSHIADLSPPSRSITCKLCMKSFHGAKILTTCINHMAKEHYDILKFCCTVCSKTFFNMQKLSNHYRDKHPNEQLSVFPCLDCGLYCQSIGQLRKHKLAQHD